MKVHTGGSRQRQPFSILLFGDCLSKNNLRGKRQPEQLYLLSFNL